MRKNILQGPAARYKNPGHVSKNINHEFQERLTTGQRVADMVARIVGSWQFIIYQSIIIIIWMLTNIYLVYMVSNKPGFLQAWDPYPFILLNLVLSFQAAYTGPVVMMSQNRQAEKDRLMAEHDYAINKKAEEEIKILMEHLVHQDELLLQMMTRLDELSQNRQISSKDAIMEGEKQGIPDAQT